MELNTKEQELIATLRGLAQPYEDSYLMVHLTPLGDTHLTQVIVGRPVGLGGLTGAFYGAFLELKKWLGLAQATFLVAMSEDYCQVFSFSRQIGRGAEDAPDVPTS